MSALLHSLDLACSKWSAFLNRRCEVAHVSRLLQKSSGSCDDEFYARNLWPCRDTRCAGVLGPLDAIVDDPKFARDVDVFRDVYEVYAETERRCPVCGTSRGKVDIFGFLRSGILR